MTIRDLRSAPADTLLTADIALVGGGPVAITIARELQQSGHTVLMLESGGVDFETEAQLLNAVENLATKPSPADPEKPGRGYTGEMNWLNRLPPWELRNRILGGSTHTWYGKCAVFDEIDFEKRDWIRNSGWPITFASLESALDRAGALLNLGASANDERLYDAFRSRPDRLEFDRDKLRPFFWQFSEERGRHGGPMRFGAVAQALNAPNIEIVTHATVTRIRLTARQDRVSSLEVRSPNGNKAIVRAGAVVLCAGGIENARLLLASREGRNKGIGNGKDVVGRYLGDHPRAIVAKFQGDSIRPIANHFGFYGLSGRDGTRFCLHGLSLSAEAQRKFGLLNCAAYPVQALASDDPFEALKRLSHGSPGRLKGDLLALASSPGLLASGAWRRLVQKRGLPRKLTGLRFDVMTEQEPDPESRVTLSDRLDRYGVPLPKVGWRIGEREVESVKHLARFMKAEFERVGLPKPELADWIEKDDNSAAGFRDMAHPSGTTRMGSDPQTSVVDANCMVHGVEGLFVAGGSVFPTPGHANPMLMIVAMAIRLADHLKARKTVREGLDGALPESATAIAL